MDQRPIVGDLCTSARITSLHLVVYQNGSLQNIELRSPQRRKARKLKAKPAAAEDSDSEYFTSRESLGGPLPAPQPQSSSLAPQPSRTSVGGDELVDEFDDEFDDDFFNGLTDADLAAVDRDLARQQVVYPQAPEGLEDDHPHVIGINSGKRGCVRNSPDEEGKFFVVLYGRTMGVFKSWCVLILPCCTMALTFVCREGFLNSVVRFNSARYVTAPKKSIAYRIWDEAWNNDVVGPPGHSLYDLSDDVRSSIREFTISSTNKASKLQPSSSRSAPSPMSTPTQTSKFKPSGSSSRSALSPMSTPTSASRKARAATPQAPPPASLALSRETSFPSTPPPSPQKSRVPAPSTPTSKAPQRQESLQDTPRPRVAPKPMRQLRRDSHIFSPISQWDKVPTWFCVTEGLRPGVYSDLYVDCLTRNLSLTQTLVRTRIVPIDAL